MAHLQTVTRILTASGAARNSTDDETVFLYTNNGTLVSKVFANEKWGDQDILARNVRANSPTAYIHIASSDVLLYLDNTSTLRALRYDDDEKEWSDDGSVPAVNLHAKGGVATCFVSDDDAKARTFYQAPSQELVCLNSTWTPSILPAKPLVGTPIFATIISDRAHVFFIDNDDRFIHYLVEQSSGVWVDNVLAKSKLDETVTQIIVSGGTNGLQACAITAQKTILEVSGGDQGVVQ